MSDVIKAYEVMRLKRRQFELACNNTSEMAKAGATEEEIKVHENETVSRAGEASFQAEKALSKATPKTVYEVLLKQLALSDQDMLGEIVDELRKDLERLVVPPSDDTPGHLRLPFGFFREPESFAEAHALYRHAEHLSMEAITAADNANDEFGAGSPKHLYAERESMLASAARQWAEIALRNAKPANAAEAVLKLTALMDPGFQTHGVRELKAEALEVANATT